MSFTAQADPWLAEVMNRPVFRVDGTGSTDELARQLRAGFFFAKLATDRVADVQALSALKFSVVDTNVTFEAIQEVEARRDFEVGELIEGEAEAVLAIAGTAFRYSRFHLDPQVDDTLAHHIKREWIRNYVLRKRGDALLVARDRGRPCGFLAALTSHGTAVIDLIAVSPDASGRGVGSALTAAFTERYRGMRRMVGTQVANIPSIRLYTKLGFALASSHYVLHAHL